MPVNARGQAALIRRALRAEVAPAFFLQVDNPCNTRFGFFHAIKQFRASAAALFHGIQRITAGGESDVLHH